MESGNRPATPRAFTAKAPANTYKTELVTETPTEPSTLPVMSSNGVAAPNSVSTMRWLLSWVTFCSMGAEPTMTIMARIMATAKGTKKPSSSLRLRAACTSPVFSSRSSRLSPSMGTEAVRPLWLSMSMPSCARRARRTPSLMGPLSQVRISSMPPALV
jgi:hypothetical protein